MHCWTIDYIFPGMRSGQSGPFLAGIIPRLIDSHAGLIFACVAIVALALTMFWIAMVIECAQNEPSEGNDKVVWILIILLLNWVGALIYYFVRRPTRVRKSSLRAPRKTSQGSGQNFAGFLLNAIVALVILGILLAMIFVQD